MVTIRTLDNGIRVALESISYVRSISFGIWVKNGSRNELPQENGVSHYIEHMMFKGTKSRTARQIAEEMDALGGQINAYTTKEYTCYHTRVLDKHIDRALDVMSDMLLHPLIAQEEVQKERNVITEEIYMYDDAPEELVHDALQDAIWRDTSLGMPILGTEETIAAFDADFIRAYYERNYHQENIVLSVAGNFEEEEMLGKLNEKLGGWKRETPFVQHDTHAAYQISCVEKEKDIEQVHVCLAFPGLTREHPQKFAEYLNSKQSAELQKEIRRLEKEKAAMQKRKAELDAIFKKLYEDSVLGRITAEQFQLLSASYTDEQAKLTEALPQREAEIQRLKETVSNTAAFLDKAKRYTDIQALTPELLRLFIQKIVVHEKEVKWSKHAPQTVEIHYADIGCMENGQTAEPEQHNEITKVS